MERNPLDQEPKNFRERAKRIGENILHWMFDPAVVGRVVNRTGAVEADIDDRGLMQYYVDNPETDRHEPLLDSRS
ncbi:MAG TPA: hypothetical protein VGA08_02425 [Candidatus Saccharimonadales bacterium]